MNSILRITDPILKDDSIDKYEEIEYGYVAGTNLNSPGQDIRLTIETQDIFTHPSESYLIVEGELTKAGVNPPNNPRYDVNAANDLITLTNNGIMHLFKRIRYDLSGQEIENLMHPGQATTMLGLLKYPDDFSKSKGLNQLWYKDTNLTAAIGNNGNVGFDVRRYYILSSNPAGTFSFKIPLKHIFGFCEDYDKIVYGLKHTLTLTRNDDNNAIFKSDSRAGNPAVDIVVDGVVTITKISWFMPHVTPADQYKMELYKIIERKEKIPVGYRMIQCDSASVSDSTSFNWRLSVKSSPEVPRFIIVGFQTNKIGNQKTNPSIFDNVDVSNIYVTLNSTRYPTVDHNIDFDRNTFSRVYGDAADFRSKFFNMDELVSNPNFTSLEYKTLYPLFLFDVSKQSEKLKYSTTDIQVKIQFRANPPPNTQVYGVIISDRLINFQSDGNKFSVVT